MTSSVFKTAAFLLVLLCSLGVTAGVPCAAEEAYGECPFATSLHHTTEGMRYWYEEEGGFMAITKVPYDQTGCKSCHVSSCATCHTKREGDKCAYSTAMAKDKETCLVCHARAKAAFGMGEKTGSLDVHIAKGMGCSDCHTGEDVHGDGTLYHSMRDPGAVKAACTNCHTFEGAEQSRAHKVHRGKLECASCHVSNSITCLNCHFENFLATKEKKGNFIAPSQDWVLLINYNGRVTTGTVQTLVYKKQKFIAYAPYYTHAIRPKGRECRDCHGNAAMELIKKGEKVPMTQFKDGAVVPWKGVVPVAPDQLDWIFLDKKEGQWVLIEDGEGPTVQFVGHGEPLTEKQIKKMGMPFAR